MTKKADLDEEEEVLVEDLLERFGSLALVFFQRAKNLGLFEDERFKSLNRQLKSCYQMEADTFDSSVFVGIFLQKLSQMIEAVSFGTEEPHSYSQINFEKSKLALYQLRQFLKILPTQKQLKKATLRLTKDYAEATGDINKNYRESVIKDIVLVKVVLDVKIKIYKAIEAPKFKVSTVEFIDVGAKQQGFASGGASP